MGATLDIYIDTATGELVSGGSIVGGALPTLTRNDSYTLRLRLLEKGPSGAYDDIDSAGASLKVGIGDIDAPPSSGNFKLSVNGVTSTDIPFNATAVCVFNAISNNVSTVALYGADSYGSYLLTASQPNTAMSFGSDTGTLFPASSVLINTRRNPTTGVNAQQVVKLIKNPAVFADTFTNTPTANEITLSNTQQGTATANETWELNFGPLVRGGLYSINYGGNSTTGIPPYQSAISVQTQLAAVTGIGTGNISVQENGSGGYTIQFVGARGLQNITTALILDASGVNFIPLKQTTLTMNTSELEDLFEESGEDTISPTLEIELTQSGSPKTIYQGTATIRRDLITTGSSVPGAQASYYTKAEADSIFVEDSTSNVDAANRILADSSSVDSVGYGARKLYDSSGSEVLGYNSGIGFFGVTAITQPSGANAVSNVISLGLIASSSTYGVLPGTLKTISVTSSITFGTITNNSSATAHVTITGANANDLILMGLPTTVCQGLSFFGHVVSANTVEIDAVNATNGSIVQSNQTFRVTLIGY